MAAVFDQPELQQEMSAQGLARAARFSWKNTAQQTVALYQKVTANETA
jgi:glycosyltransferase involved in cell wall biosynthesis